jgi:ATP-dependent DNA helicase 2 subunit 1
MFQEWHEDPLNDALNQDDEENEEAEYHEYHEKDSILFLIDASVSMFEKTLEEVKSENEKDVIPFYYAVKCASQAYCDKIISSTSDVMGVVFYGTREKKNQYDFDNVYIFHDIDIPDANRIKQLENVVNSEDFDKNYGHATTKGSLHEALWTCQHLFSHVPKNVGYKRIFLFTCDDNPITSVDVRNKCLERSKDLIESDITIELFVLKPKTAAFDPNIFWNKLIAVSEDEYTGTITFDFADRLEVLRDKVRRKEYKKRSLGTIPFELAPNVLLSVNLYNLVQPAKKNLPTYLHADTNRPLRSETKQVCEDTGTELMASDIIYAYDYGGQSVHFEKEDLQHIRNQITSKEQSIKLIGFKPRSRLRIPHNVRPSSFIHPTDKSITGSTSAFAALHRKMLEMDRIAICRLIARTNSDTVYVALLPAEEKIDDDGIQIEPPGFHVIFLPYADGYRKLTVSKPKDAKTADDKTISAAKKIAKKISFNFDSMDFDNPALQKHYAALQALALERKTIEEIKDHVTPDVEGMKKYKEEVENFCKMVFPEGYEPEPPAKTSRGKKRAPEGDGGEVEGNIEIKEEESTEERPKKKARVKKESKSDDEDDSAPIDMVKLAKENKVGTLKLLDLKEFCKIYKLPVSGAKQVIVDRIMEFLRSKKKI